MAAANSDVGQGARRSWFRDPVAAAHDLYRVLLGLDGPELRAALSEYWVATWGLIDPRAPLDNLNDDLILGPILGALDRGLRPHGFSLLDYIDDHQAAKDRSFETFYMLVAAANAIGFGHLQDRRFRAILAPYERAFSAATWGALPKGMIQIEDVADVLMPRNSERQEGREEQ